MPEEITQLLQRWGAGEAAALDRLLPLVYDELRQLARSYMRRQAVNHSLQPTALVHEAWLRLGRQQAGDWQNRVQFFALAAKVMRNVLVDHVRQHAAEKRGGAQELLSLRHAEQQGQETEFELLALDEALQRLAALNAQHAHIVELRFFGGLTIDETAQVLGISHATVERGWHAARAWLFSELQR
ncbi:MAG: sigma-70 family RNA polymerase sigma factor [Acidobacteria bacterium]|nr:sigma-70 family RNA polymerase sigma factor [Acidobacteriota bacterium]MBI3423434.1 sigma-70 family RNA polymerase sigma factor [Acidobacteriota bacterium]